MTKKKILFVLALVSILAIAIASITTEKFINGRHFQHRAKKNPESETTTSSLPTSDQAIKVLFGVDKKTGTLITSANELNQHWFSYQYEINGDSFYAIFLKTFVLLGEEITVKNIPRCHACAPEISIVTYKKKDGAWYKLASQEKMKKEGTWGDVETPQKIESMRLNQNNVTLLINFESQQHDQRSAGKSLYAFSKNSWKFIGYIGTNADNSNHCNDPTAQETVEYIEDAFPCYSYRGSIKPIKNQQSNFPDLFVQLEGTTLDEENKVKRVDSVRYRYKKGTYEALQ